jgi:DNA polymerase-3 subunit epsilon
MTTAAPMTRDEKNARYKQYGYRWGREGADWILRDIRGAAVTERMALETIEAIKSGKIEKPKPVISTASRAAAIEWAHSLVNRTQRDRPVVILDTETTGVDMAAVAVQIGVVDLRGIEIMNIFIHPDGTEISQGAFETHGLTIEKLSDAPLFPSIWELLQGILLTADILTFNAPFDSRLLTQTAAKYGLTMPPLRTHCVMQQYSMYVGEVSSPPLKPETYAVQSLEKACAHFGIENSGAHDALGDAMATRDVLIAMAALYED